MNSEIRIKQLEERVAYLETIAQSSAHEILTAYIHDMLSDARYIVNAIVAVYARRHN